MFCFCEQNSKHVVTSSHVVSFSARGVEILHARGAPGTGGGALDDEHGLPARCIPPRRLHRSFLECSRASACRRRIFRERSGEEESGVRRARGRAGVDFGARGRDDREQNKRTGEGERGKTGGEEEEDEEDEEEDER